MRTPPICMMSKKLYIVTALLLPLFLCRCVTTEQALAQTPPIVVQGTLFYPDDSNKTYIVPAGAEIIGAGGSNCRFIVESGGRMTAHSGTNNTYKIKSGGAFKGFDHPATNCRVQYQNGANVAQINAGKGVSFTLVN